MKLFTFFTQFLLSRFALSVIIETKSWVWSTGVAQNVSCVVYMTTAHPSSKLLPTFSPNSGFPLQFPPSCPSLVAKQRPEESEKLSASPWKLCEWFRWRSERTISFFNSFFLSVLIPLFLLFFFFFFHCCLSFPPPLCSYLFTSFAPQRLFFGSSVMLMTGGIRKEARRSSHSQIAS